MHERQWKHIHIIFSFICAIIFIIIYPKIFHNNIIWRFFSSFLGFLLGYILFYIITFIIQIINGGVVPRNERKMIAKNYLENFKKIITPIYPNKKDSFLLKHIEKIIEEIFRKSVHFEPYEETGWNKEAIGKATMSLVNEKESNNIRRLYKTVYLQIINDLSQEVNNDIVFPANSCIDIDGNVYQTVQIGDQVWMAENLKVTHYRNGDPIRFKKEVKQYLFLLTEDTDSEWQNLSSGAYCVYDDFPPNAETYGNLYNWFAVDDSRGLAPEGWHIPTDEEIKELEMALGMSQSEADDEECYRGTNEGSKLAGRSDLWLNKDLRNNQEFGTSGFCLLPGGSRDGTGRYYRSMGKAGIFWSSTEATEYGSSSAWCRLCIKGVTRFGYYKQAGFSVRCVRDEIINRHADE